MGLISCKIELATLIGQGITLFFLFGLVSRFMFVCVIYVIDLLLIHCSSVSSGGRQLCNLWFADDINLLGNSEEDLQQLTQRLEETAAEYGMKMSFNKSKILVSSIKSRLSANIQMDGHTLEEVDQFTYLGSRQTKDGTSVKEVKIRLAQAHSAMTRLAVLWKKQSHQFS